MSTNLPAPEVPKKPIHTRKWLGYVVLGFVVIYLVILFVERAGSSDVKTKQQDQSERGATAASPNAGDTYSSALQRQAHDLLEARKTKVDEPTSENRKSLQDVIAHLPACDATERRKLAGQYYIAVGPDNETVRLTCDQDNLWKPMPDGVISLEPTTPAQNARMQSGGGNGSGQGVSKKEKAAQAREAALNSSSIALDFHEKKPAAELEDTKEDDARLVPVSTDARPVEPKTDQNKYPWDTYTGPLFRVFEGDVIETILTNRLSGEYTGPVNAMVTTNLYSRDRQHILIPQGTRILGQSTKVNATGQRRLAIVFHRAIMPDGFSIDFDKFNGLDQQGAEGISGKVNTHLAKLIGTAVLVGAIGGLAQAGNSSTITTLGAVRMGVGEQAGQEATQILERALNTLPTITVFEGTRIRIWPTKDLTLPGYEFHTVSPTL